MVARLRVSPERPLLAPAAAAAAAGSKKRKRKCSLCSLSLERKDLRAHYKQCCLLLILGNPERAGRKGFLGTYVNNSEKQVDAVLTALDPAVGLQLRRFSNSVVEHYSRCGNRGCRTNHEGRLYGLGWSKRWGCLFGPTDECAQATREGADKLLTATLSPQTRFGRALEKMILDWDQRLPSGSVGAEGGPCCFVGVNYSPVSKVVDKAQQLKVHGMPGEVQWTMWPTSLLKSCSNKCVTCKTKGCVECEFCPLHLDKKDTSSTVLLLWQPRDTPAAQSAKWLLGERAFPINQGIACVFNGRVSPHGVWIPAEHDAEKWPIFGCAFVHR